MAEWIGRIQIDSEVEAKLRHKHDLTGDQVREAVAWGAADVLAWHDDPKYGLRLVASGRDAHGIIEVYLRPLDAIDGTWECLTAWRQRT